MTGYIVFGAIMMVGLLGGILGDGTPRPNRVRPGRGVTASARRQDCELKMLEDHYSARREEVDADLREAMRRLNEAANDPDPRDRLYARMRDVDCAIEAVRYIKQGQANVAAIC
ncbi:hypothetical protein DFR67_103159 [Williamsia limnetica]|uniref:Uncharacterized protein n=1 Tax=Williamsia limnetica TaxID=882452 RepID=A0A318RTF4_WILLI|nr:hypothetical protein [Williamsia limnetica]PYE19248.1 hypothetical protein DFR67_103159 [Williamsia limnetica]